MVERGIFDERNEVDLIADRVRTHGNIMGIRQTHANPSPGSIEASRCVGKLLVVTKHSKQKYILHAMTWHDSSPQIQHHILVSPVL